MRTKKVDVSKKIDKDRDPDFINAEIALKRAAQKARKRAQQAGIGVFVMKEGRIVEEYVETNH